MQGQDFAHSKAGQECPQSLQPRSGDDLRCDGASDAQPRGTVDQVRLVQLCDELANARNAIASILTDIESITMHQNPSIEAEWQVKVGVWETRLLEAQIAMRRAKRKCALVQACVNRDAHVDDQRIEQQLDSEFEEWHKKLKEAAGSYQRALQVRNNTVKISAAQSQSLKEVFRVLAKRLHPDINDNPDEGARMMFFLAQSAYKQADLAMLESLEVSTRGMEANTRMPLTVEDAEAELAVALGHANALQERWRKLVNDKPYCLLALLRDQEWLEGHVAQLQEEIRACEQAEQEYRTRYEQQGARDD